MGPVTPFGLENYSGMLQAGARKVPSPPRHSAKVLTRREIRVMSPDSFALLASSGDIGHLCRAEAVVRWVHIVGHHMLNKGPFIKTKPKAHQRLATVFGCDRPDYRLTPKNSNWPPAR